MSNLTIILVHGAWGDGSHWRHIIPILDSKGYKVKAVQNPLTSLQDDIDKTTDLINMQDGKVLLVGHSYGGAVITGAGNHDKVAGLVYVAAFAPDTGESLGGIFERREKPMGAASIQPDDKGFLWIKYNEFHKAFCQDLSEKEAMVMSLSQHPIHGRCFGDETAEPAWKHKPSWYQVSNQDHMIPPKTEQEMAERMNPKKIVHLDSSHTSLASHPEKISDLIIEAAESLG